jgi:SAM-dependent methyltransferase
MCSPRAISRKPPAIFCSAARCRIRKSATNLKSNGIWPGASSSGCARKNLAAAEWGYHPVGLDLRQSEVAKLKSVGIEAHCQDISRLDHPGRYAVISMADVIEHMPFPATALMAADRLLAPDGLLVISTPNSGSPTWDLMTKFDANPYWGEIEHYHNFSRQRLTAFLEEFGFQVIHFAVAERYKLGMEIIAKRMEAFDDQTDVD